MRNPNLGLIEETPPPVGINTQQRSRAEDDDRMIVDEPQDWTVHSARLSVSLAQMTASFEQNKLAGMHLIVFHPFGTDLNVQKFRNLN